MASSTCKLCGYGPIEMRSRECKGCGAEITYYSPASRVLIGILGAAGASAALLLGLFSHSFTMFASWLVGTVLAVWQIQSALMAVNMRRGKAWFTLRV